MQEEWHYKNINTQYRDSVKDGLNWLNHGSSLNQCGRNWRKQVFWQFLPKRKNLMAIDNNSPAIH